MSRRILATLKREFQVRNLWLNHGVNGQGRVQWRQAFAETRFSSSASDSTAVLPAVMLVLWRFCVAGFALGATVASIVLEETDGDDFSFGYWMWYLTHWVMLIHTLYGVGLFASTVLIRSGWYSAKADNDVMPRLVQATWMLMSMSLTAGLFVLLLNWILLRPVNPSPSNILQHGVVWASIVLDFMLGKQPVLLLHAVWCSVVGLCYGAWTLIHSSLDLHNKRGCACIYEVINWELSPGTAAFWAFGSPLLIVPVLHAVFWCAQVCRVVAVVEQEEENQVVAAEDVKKEEQA